MSESFRYDIPGGATLDGLVDIPAGEGPFPTVLVCHGFKGFMEWAFFPALAELLASRGFLAVRINFSGSGMRPGEDRVADLEAFRTATVTKDVAETVAVLGALSREIAPGRVDPNRVGLLGHSRGGGSSILTCADEGARSRVRSLVTWNAVSTYDRFSEAELARWRETGEHVILNARTGQELPLGLEVLEDAERNAARLDPLAAAGTLEVPWLVVHGEADETVPIFEGRALAAACPTAELVEIRDGSHTFGAQHPFVGPTRELIAAMNATQAHFRRTL